MSAQNPRQYVLPIKYVIGIRAHRTRETRQKQCKTDTNNQTKNGDRKEVSKWSDIGASLPIVEIKERE